MRSHSDVLLTVVEKRQVSGQRFPVLVIVDGHSSRVNPDMLMNCLYKDVIMLNLPSHLTHILQPNDSGVNRMTKLSTSWRLQYKSMTRSCG